MIFKSLVYILIFVTMTALVVNARQNHSENKDHIQPTLTYEKIETENPETSLKILTGWPFILSYYVGLVQGPILLNMYGIILKPNSIVFMTPKLGPYGFIRL